MIGSVAFLSFNRLMTIAVCVLLCVVFLVSCASGEYEGRDSSSSTSNDRAPSNEFGSCSDGKCIKRTSQDITSGMWFGPRLGRRRRADRKPEVDSDIETLANALDGSRWAVITIPGSDRRQATQFTPRLGRESGRKVPWTPTPRLGRQLHNIINKPRQNFDDARF
ncbi:PBAN-type neuropeptides-like isoform X3 [Bombus pyrosoma]|uniref:PBAN-type neuropeptides-like isoform X3 n=1 Tax=Bombus pyrosoma TaxID=396416 RepID=UPI001CB8C402|nr:PBAN-type neuropeptides-like isoform X3 [Bombus pyrosoma]